MNFPHGETVERLRPVMIPDPYNPDQIIPGDWSDPDIFPIERAFVAQTSTSLLVTATREQAAESKSLFCDRAADVRKGDRIRVGGETGPVYTIDGIPPAGDVNPFTGWAPPREIPLTRYEG